jgi:hypothetical protein
MGVLRGIPHNVVASRDDTLSQHSSRRVDLANGYAVRGLRRIGLAAYGRLEIHELLT